MSCSSISTSLPNSLSNDFIKITITPPKQVQFSKHIRHLRLFCHHQPTKSNLHYQYALYPLNYLPQSPKLINRLLNHHKSHSIDYYVNQSIQQHALNLNLPRNALKINPNVSLVKLENCLMRDTGILEFNVHVSNLQFHKSVIIRYSTTNWMNYKEITCVYKKSSILNNEYYYGVDEFSAMLDSHKLTHSNESNENELLESNLLHVSNALPIHHVEMQFCIKYQLNDTVIWDNNNNKNYTCSVHLKPVELMDLIETDSEMSSTTSYSKNSRNSKRSHYSQVSQVSSHSFSAGKLKRQIKAIN
eukprot:NODE_261_length_11439_cov_1.285538.p3 type:complete len:302 gc:universal NODE_261_length_11439_cov_1.285538:7654-8559(+)